MTAELTKSVIAVMEGVKRLAKDDRNEHGKYNYVSVDDVKDLVRPLMAKHGLEVVINEIGWTTETTRSTDFKTGAAKETLNARFTFEIFLRHASGVADKPECTSVMLPYTGAQTTGAAKSYALKEWLKGRFMLSTGEKDADADSHPPQEYERRDAKKPPPTYDRNPLVQKEFTKLQNGIRQIEQVGNLEDLALFWKSNADSIKAMPADWKAELEAMKDEAKDALSSKVPA